MVDTLEKLNEFGWFNIILVLVLVIAVIPVAIDTWKKLLKSLKLKPESEIESEETEKKISSLRTDLDALRNDFDTYVITKEAQYNQYHNESICIRNDLKDDIKSLISKLDEYIKMDNEKTIATLRTSLWRMHKEFITQGYVTPDGLKTFLEMGKIYERSGGNDIYHEKLLPEVESLEIHYPDGSIYHHSL